MADIVQLEENGVKQYLKTHAKAVEGLLDMFFPVGAIFQSNKDKNPSTFMGGTWERYAKGQVLVGVNESDTDFSVAGKTGGEKAHTLTVDELASHTHKYNSSNVNNLVQVTPSNVYGRTANIESTTGNAGGDKAHNNLQPYISVYMWVRTA